MRHRRRRREPRALILMYHMVDRAPFDPWGLCVRPEHFAEQLAVIAERCVPTRLDDLAEALRRGRVPDRAVVLTFDDGYRNNLRQALPALRERSVPATVFVTSGTVGCTRVSWWDELAAILLRPIDLPPVWAPRDIGPRRVGMPPVELGEARWSHPSSWQHDVAWREAGRCRPSPRMSLFLQLWEALLPFEPSARQLLLDDLARWAGAHDEPHECHRMLDATELAELADDPLVAIGAHTRSHPLLARLPADEASRELEGGRDDLVALLDRPVTSVAYPFGSHTQATVAAAHAGGFTVACTTEPAPVTARSHLLRLPRVDVKDANAETFARVLDQWLGA